MEDLNGLDNVLFLAAIFAGALTQRRSRGRLRSTLIFISGLAELCHTSNIGVVFRDGAVDLLDGLDLLDLMDLVDGVDELVKT